MAAEAHPGRPVVCGTPADGGPEQVFRNPTSAHTALMKVGGAGHIERTLAGTLGRTIVAVSNDEGDITTLAMSCERIENGFPVRCASNQDGDRHACIDPAAYAMSGCGVEVGLDPKWNPSLGGWQYKPSDHDRRRSSHRTGTSGLASHLGRRWSTGVDLSFGGYPRATTARVFFSQSMTSPAAPSWPDHHHRPADRLVVTDRDGDELTSASLARPPTTPPPAVPPCTGPTGERADWWWYDPFQPQPPPTTN